MFISSGGFFCKGKDRSSELVSGAGEGRLQVFSVNLSRGGKESVRNKDEALGIRVRLLGEQRYSAFNSFLRAYRL